ncbi:MAG TPA: hypothetical protein VMJ32_12395 [Pirellulales bacterium]|nr:hypothetical protein [Pirellulales bacterium]
MERLLHRAETDIVTQFSRRLQLSEFICRSDLPGTLEKPRQFLLGAKSAGVYSANGFRKLLAFEAVHALRMNFSSAAETPKQRRDVSRSITIAHARPLS